MRTEFIGDIATVRVVEDCIRATKKYTKSAFRKPIAYPIQGEEFPSKVLTEYYEVYPEMEPSWDMSWPDFWMWVWGDTPHIDVLFQYDYRVNRGKVTVRGNNNVLDMLKDGIPDFEESLGKVMPSCEPQPPPNNVEPVSRTV